MRNGTNGIREKLQHGYTHMLQPTPLFGTKTHHPEERLLVRVVILDSVQLACQGGEVLPLLRPLAREPRRRRRAPVEALLAVVDGALAALL